MLSRLPISHFTTLNRSAMHMYRSRWCAHRQGSAVGGAPAEAVIRIINALIAGRAHQLTHGCAGCIPVHADRRFPSANWLRSVKPCQKPLLLPMNPASVSTRDFCERRFSSPRVSPVRRLSQQPTLAFPPPPLATLLCTV